MKRAVIGFALTIFALLPAACGRSAAPEARLTVTGSSTIAPVMVEIARRYEKQNPGIKIDVQSGGSARGIADTRSGSAQIGMVSRGPEEDEHDLEWYGLARDGVGIIVNAANPVSSLSTRQIVDLYTGRHSDWQSVSGAAGPVSVVNKAEGRSTLEVFLKYFALRNSEIHAHVVIGDNQQGIKTVAGNPGAIGYVSIGSAEVAIQEGVAIKLLPANGVAASVANVGNGSFPIARTLHLVTKGAVAEPTRRFLTYARSEEVHDIIASQYFVPLVR